MPHGLPFYLTIETNRRSASSAQLQKTKIIHNYKPNIKFEKKIIIIIGQRRETYKGI